MLQEACVLRGRSPWQLLALGVAFVADGVDVSLAPWYCPPVEPQARQCVREHRLFAPSYVEDFLAPASVNVLIHLNEEPTVDTNWTGPSQTLLELIEAVRIFWCVERFADCYSARLFRAQQRELCTIIGDRQHQLATFEDGGVSEHACAAMYREGDALHLSRAISRPLHGLVRRAFPAASPPVLANEGSRFHYEYFFEKSAALMRKHVSEGVSLRPLVLSYPAIFSPGQLCALARRPGGAPPVEPDVEAALRSLRAARVPLSRFAVNFGAADGACGSRDDWNADPANCLAAAGSAALLMEGNPRWWPDLVRRFGGRENVTLFLDYVQLDTAADLLDRHLREHPLTASRSPDLLKMDIDHADCLFMAEALEVLRPKLIHLEYWPLIPPPLEYLQHYRSNLLEVGQYSRTRPPLEGGDTNNGTEHAGCSLSAFIALAPRYALAAVGPEEALLIRRDLVPPLLAASEARKEPLAWLPQQGDAFEAWVQGALCHPLHGRSKGNFAWGFDFRALAEPSASHEDRASWLSGLFAERGASGFSLHVGGTAPREPRLR